MSERVISLKRIDATAITKELLVDSLVDMGLDWLTYDSTMDEIKSAIAMVGSIGFDIGSVEEIIRGKNFPNSTANLSKVAREEPIITFFPNEEKLVSDLRTLLYDITDIVTDIKKDNTVDNVELVSNLPITAVQIDNKITEIVVNGEHQLIWSGEVTTGATIVYSDLTFASSDELKCTVSEEGVVKGIDIGDVITIRVIANNNNDIYDEFTLNVV